MRIPAAVLTIATAVFLLSGQVSYAQTSTTEDQIDPSLESELAADGEDVNDETQDGGISAANFSRHIPAGLAGNLSDEETVAFQARLDAAATPQERNAIRHELQRLNQQRHQEQAQAKKIERKGLWENMTADFRSIMNGNASAHSANRGGNELAAAAKGKTKGEKNGGGKDRSGKGGGKNK